MSTLLIKPNYSPSHPSILPPTHRDKKVFRAFEKNRFTLVFLKLKNFIHYWYVKWKDRQMDHNERAFALPFRRKIRFCALKNHELLRLLLPIFSIWSLFCGLILIKLPIAVRIIILREVIDFLYPTGLLNDSFSSTIYMQCMIFSNENVVLNVNINTVTFKQHYSI